MQTNAREVFMSSLSDRKLLSIFCLPGHHMPGTPPHCAAAVIKRIGFPVLFASAKPSFNMPYQTMPETIFLLFGTLPPNEGPVGGESWALTGEEIATTATNVDNASVRKFCVFKLIFGSRCEYSTVGIESGQTTRTCLSKQTVSL